MKRRGGKKKKRVRKSGKRKKEKKEGGKKEDWRRMEGRGSRNERREYIKFFCFFELIIVINASLILTVMKNLFLFWLF